MERPIEGKNLLFFIDPANGTNYSLVVCLTNQSFNRAANVIDATSKCGTRKLNGTKDRTIDIEGQVMYDPDAGHVSEAALNNYFEADTSVGWKMSQATPEVDDVIYSGTDAVISNVVLAAPLDGVTTFTATLQLTGVPTQTIFEGS
jgi:predicted secreted protein